ncbi:MAG: hypothetical protein ABSH20_18075 [Tepidisphaeraceae bacterium]
MKDLFDSTVILAAKAEQLPLFHEPVAVVRPETAEDRRIRRQYPAEKTPVLFDLQPETCRIR